AVTPAIAATLLARYVVNSYSIRVVVMSSAIALLLGLASRRLFREPAGVRLNPGRRPAAYWLAAASGVLVVRVVATLILGGAPPLLEEDATANFAVALSVIIGLGAVFSYFLLFRDRKS